MSNHTALETAELINPTETGPKPPYESSKMTYPGSPKLMSPAPDHGEDTYRGSGRLKHRKALITGGDSGIGRAIAIAFAREGADVAISYLPEEEVDATETSRLVQEAGSKSLCLPGDLRDEQHCTQLIEKTISAFGGIDILVNNAAFQATHEKIEDISTDEFDRTFRTNVYATFWLCKTALPQMKAGSAILNTASIQSFDPSPSLVAYAATKAAIVSLTKSLSQIAMKQGVRVNAVAPGPVWTPLIPSTMPEEKVRKFGEDTTFGRVAQPVEIAPVFVFLASNEARYVTGEVYGATGGQTPY